MICETSKFKIICVKNCVQYSLNTILIKEPSSESMTAHTGQIMIQFLKNMIHSNSYMDMIIRHNRALKF